MLQYILYVWKFVSVDVRKCQLMFGTDKNFLCEKNIFQLKPFGLTRLSLHKFHKTMLKLYLLNQKAKVNKFMSLLHNWMALQSWCCCITGTGTQREHWNTGYLGVLGPMCMFSSGGRCCSTLSLSLMDSQLIAADHSWQKLAQDLCFN